MSVIKEWNCVLHGEFDGSHPICPEMGCDSKAVVREFRTAPTIRSSTMKKFDAGIRRSSDMMKINNFRTAREGEAAYGGDAGKASGLQVLWGSESNKVLGRSFAELTAIAQKPLHVPKRDGSGTLSLTRNNAMREAATEAGITRRALPQVGELAVVKSDKQSDAKAKSMTA